MGSVLVIIDPKPTRIGLPTEAYKVVEEIHDDGSPTDKTFEHVPTEIGSEEHRPANGTEGIKSEAAGYEGLFRKGGCRGVAYEPRDHLPDASDVHCLRDPIGDRLAQPHQQQAGEQGGGEEGGQEGGGEGAEGEKGGP